MDMVTKELVERIEKEVLPIEDLQTWAKHASTRELLHWLRQAEVYPKKESWQIHIVFREAKNRVQKAAEVVGGH